MAYGDGAGPAGAGSMTGRSAGFCAGYGTPGRMNAGPGRGCGMGYGHGGRHGRGRGVDAAYAYTEAINEKNLLKNETAALESELNAVKQRLNEPKKTESKLGFCPA